MKCKAYTLVCAFFFVAMGFLFTGCPSKSKEEAKQKPAATSKPSYVMWKMQGSSLFAKGALMTTPPGDEDKLLTHMVKYFYWLGSRCKGKDKQPPKQVNGSLVLHPDMTIRNLSFSVDVALTRCLRSSTANYKSLKYAAKKPEKIRFSLEIR